ncbi:CRISPR-associated protein, Csm2 family [hydrothermal vent metagenome]|uniref:CRISPR system Cms protein Csm2 n=1 Tax=hydrothermal vent metagenome TaxID=652676 RepID=A0A1W1CT13_9ZZZZ
MIELDYTKDVELFNKTAFSWAKKIGTGRGGVQNTQMRKFYDQVLNLYQKAKPMNDEEFQSDLLPFVKMLNSKVAYASTRSSGGGKIVNSEFVNMMSSCINQVSTKKDLNTFKLFFEAVIGFHKGEE